MVSAEAVKAKPESTSAHAANKDRMTAGTTACYGPGGKAIRISTHCSAKAAEKQMGH